MVGEALSRERSWDDGNHELASVKTILRGVLVTFLVGIKTRANAEPV